jgi:hypothetical protein
MKVDAMEVSMDVQIPMKSTVARITQPVHDSLTTVKVTSHRVVLAYVGACAVVCDNVAGWVKDGTKLLSAAEDRGERMRAAVVQRLQSVEQKASGEIKRVQTQIEESVEHTKSGVAEAGHGVTDELEKRVELVLANLGVPSRDRLERLSKEIDELNEKLDAELMRT